MMQKYLTAVQTQQTKKEEEQKNKKQTQYDRNKRILFLPKLVQEKRLQLHSPVRLPQELRMDGFERHFRVQAYSPKQEIQSSLLCTKGEKFAFPTQENSPTSEGSPQRKLYRINDQTSMREQIPDQKLMVQQFVFKIEANRSKIIQRRNLNFCPSMEVEKNWHIFLNHIRNDLLLAQNINSQNIQNFTCGHQQLLGLAFGKTIISDRLIIKQAHLNLQVSDEMFERMKRALIQILEKQTLVVDEIFSILQTVESYRNFIVKNEAQNDEDDITEAKIIETSHLMYEKIYKNYILRPHFKSIDQKQQALKFHYILCQLIMKQKEKKYSFVVLRKKHQGYNFTPLHFAYFKLHLYQSMEFQEYQKKDIIFTLNRMDGFKASVMNIQSIYELICETTGFDSFVDKFNQSCLQEADIVDFIFQVGIDKYNQHSKYMLYYFLNPHLFTFSLQELYNMHRSHNLFSQKIFVIFKKHLYINLLTLRPYDTLLEDLMESIQTFQEQIFDSKLQYLRQDLQINLYPFVQVVKQSTQKYFQLQEFFDKSNISLSKTIKKTLRFLSEGSHHFKKSDLKIIHHKLNIPKYIYDDYVRSFSEAINNYDISYRWIIDKLNEYKQIIVNPEAEENYQEVQKEL